MYNIIYIYIYTYYNMYTVYLLVNASYIIFIYLSILFVYKQRAVFFFDLGVLLSRGLHQSKLA